MAADSPRVLESHQLSGILHSIQRRAVDRGSLSDNASNSATWKSHSSNADILRDLQEDLALSAKVGGALLEEKAALEKRVLTAEGANQKLLDRLTASVKEATQLQRRLEDTVSNLEQAESNNRSLLVSLEEGRKTISRLSHDSGKLIAASSQLKTLTQAHEDVKQELVAERKRADTVETRFKKQVERVSDMEERLRRAIEDLEEMRQDKVLRSRKSHDALAKVRARFGSSADGPSLQNEATALAGNPEATELLKIVQSLVNENDLLRSESMELHELLDNSRDEQHGLRTQMAHRDILAEEDEDPATRPDDEAIPRHSRRNSAITGAHNLLAEVLSSPSVTQTASNYFSDFDGHRPYSPVSIAGTSVNRSWAPGPSLSHSQRGANLSRTLSCGSASGGEDTAVRQNLSFDGRRSHKRRSSITPAGVSATMLPHRQPPVAGGRVPFGRGHSRRSASVDVTSVRNLDSDQARTAGDSVPTSPYIDSPHQRAPSVYSFNSEGDESAANRPKRHHRPLSLSLGPSLFPLVPEDEPTRSPGGPSLTRRRSSQPAVLPYSNSGEPSLGSAPSGASLSTSEQPQIDRPVVTVETSTQTSPFAELPRRSRSPPSTSTPIASSSARSRSPQPDFSRSNTSLSELSEGDKLVDQIYSSSGAHDSRTAVLAKLIEHTSKLLARIQAADIVSQEKRLKKQNLPGGVRHLAQANLKDVLADVEGLRHHFRRVLEQERVEAPRDSYGDLHPSESLVLRRDFVALVKLFRDLLFETSRLRALVNRVQLEPHLAPNLRELDMPNAFDVDPASKPATSGGGGGLLAPLSRLITAALSSEPEAATPKASLMAPPRPAPKRSGSSAVSSTEVSVEFGGGAARRAIANEGGATIDGSPGPDQARESPVTTTMNRKTGSQVRRDLNSIFAGSSSSSANGARPAGSADRWTNVARPSVPSNPFGRLLASYRPAPTSTANAVLDSLPHAPASRPDTDEQPTLLERQLRPRGLSDSSIRSTFVAHANPHHRVITPASLSLSMSSETTLASAVPILVKDIDEQGLEREHELSRGNESGMSSSMMTTHALKHQLSNSLLSTSALGGRRPSSANLKSRKSVAQLRTVSAPGAPTLTTTTTTTSSSSDTTMSSPPHPVPSSSPSSDTIPIPVSRNSSSPGGLVVVTQSTGTGVESTSISMSRSPVAIAISPPARSAAATSSGTGSTPSMSSGVQPSQSLLGGLTRWGGRQG